MQLVPSNVGGFFLVFFPVIFYGWMVSEEKAAKEAGMDPENYQVGWSRLQPGRTAWYPNSKKTFRNDMFQDGPEDFLGEEFMDEKSKHDDW